MPHVKEQEEDLNLVKQAWNNKAKIEVTIYYL